MRALWIGIGLLCGCVAEQSRPVGEEVDPSVLYDHTVFADPVLEQVVRKALGHPRGALQKEELQALQVLDAARTGITDLAGIELLENLRQVRLGGNGFVGLSSLSSLRHLQMLDLRSSGVSELDALMALDSLQVLVLADNGLQDISTLSALRQIRQLDLSHNQIGDIESLSSLTRLALLNIEDNRIGDVSSLLGMSALRHVELSGNPLDDRTVLDALRRRGIEVVYYVPPQEVGHTLLEDAIRLQVGKPTGELLPEDFLSISEVDLYGALGAIDGIERLVNIQRISIRGVEAPLYDISPLVELAQLREVSIFNTQLSNVRGFEKMPALRVLHLNRNRIEDLTPLVELPLSELSVGDNQLQDIFPLRTLTDLEMLNVQNNRLRDLEPLKALRKLKELDFSGNDVRDISFMEDTRLLYRIDMRGNSVRNIAPLMKMVLLQSVELGGNPLDDVSRAEIIPALRERGVLVIGAPE